MPNEPRIVDGTAIENHQIDAILMSLSAIAIMAHTRHDCWRNYAILVGIAKTDDDRAHFTECRDRDSEVLQRLCELVDAAMQYIGDANNGCDAVDEYGLTDPAFAQMARALGRSPARRRE